MSPALVHAHVGHLGMTLLSHGYDVHMDDPLDKTTLTETGTLRSASPPPPAESSNDAAPRTDADTTDALDDEERRGWPDEPTTS